MLIAMQAHLLTPIINVADIDASFAWFERFGWQKRWDYGEPPSFGVVGNGPCEIFLCQNAQGGRGPGLGAWMTMWVTNVDAVYENCQAQGIEVIRPPTDEPWNVREMHVRHPDGHVFRVSQSAPHDHEHPHSH